MTRNETDEEQADRKFADILQELRVMQTGVQLTAGFLLTLPFQRPVRGPRRRAAGDLPGAGGAGRA